MSAIRPYLKQAVEQGCSDLLLLAGKPVSGQKCGELMPLAEEKLTPEDSDLLIREIYRSASRPYRCFLDEKDDTFSFSLPGLARFRVSAYRQRSSRAAVVHIVQFGIPDWEQLSIPGEVMRLAEIPHGLVLVTGPGGSGRSTTLACLVDAINAARSVHIVTIEDPIEYLHQNKKAAVSQRELDTDTGSVSAALRASLRQCPQVIAASELPDPESVQAALTAAETGCLVFSTLNTLGAAGAVGRIIGCVPAERQQMVRIQLAQVLQAVVTQQLLPAVDGGQVPAFEVVRLNDSVRGMILDGRTEQIDMMMQNLPPDGTVRMDDALLELYRSGRITKETALSAAVNAEQLNRKLRLTM